MGDEEEGRGIWLEELERLDTGWVQSDRVGGVGGGEEIKQ